METITRNQSPRVREATLHGRKYLVAPLTLIVPGVLNGSQGPLFYPEDEIGRNPDAWNGVPIVVRHPQDSGGKHRSGRDPDVINVQGIGYVYRARSNGKLRAEGWFDVDRTEQVDRRVLENLRAGRPVELSTGLFTDNEPAENGASYKGKGYTHVARNYRPDHLAILPDQEGACSVRDGCGVNVNAKKVCAPKLTKERRYFVRDYLKSVEAGKPLTVNPFVSERQRRYLWQNEPEIAKAWAHGRHTSKKRKRASRAKDKQVTSNQGRRDMTKIRRLKPEVKASIIDDLINNCSDCGWTEEDRETLNAIPDQKLMTMDECRKAMMAKNEELEASEKKVKELETVVANAKKAVEPEKEEKKVTANEKIPLTNEEVLAALTPEMKEDLAFARAEKARQKNILVTKLTANVEDEAQRAALAKRLEAKPLDELSDLLALVPAKAEDQVSGGVPDYSGAAAGAPTINKAKLTYVPPPGEMTAGEKVGK